MSFSLFKTLLTIKIKKEYSNDEIILSWKPKKCIHAKECIKRLPKVYKFEKNHGFKLKLQQVKN